MPYGCEGASASDKCALEGTNYGSLYLSDLHILVAAITFLSSRHACFEPRFYGQRAWLILGCLLPVLGNWLLLF